MKVDIMSLIGESEREVEKMQNSRSWTPLEFLQARLRTLA
jgi:hypothetical protein